VYPFSLECNESVVGLYELKEDGRFQMTQIGKVGPVMIGYGYVLFENKVANYLNNLDIEGLRLEKATIWDRKSGIEYPNYQKAVISHHFSSDQINDINIDGLRFLLMENRYLFASPSLTKIIEESMPSIFHISEGLSEFG